MPLLPKLELRGGGVFYMANNYTWLGTKDAEPLIVEPFARCIRIRHKKDEAATVWIAVAKPCPFCSRQRNPA